ncbi:MAG: hypothetical protein LBB77_05415, partial [Treponema sp.]|nr:hypothetical protein [Treponema sp.]
AVISGNTADYAGGGVVVYDGDFEMSGGTVNGNTAGYGGGGVYVIDGSFTMKLDAAVAVDNPVHLSSGMVITLSGPLSADPAANITLVDPAVSGPGTQVLGGDTAANYSKFLLNGERDRIDSAGLLQ